MSDIRFNQWLHQSGTGGVSQSDGGHVGIGTTNPLLPVGAGNTHILHVGVVTSNSISAGSSITATTFYGSGANLTSLPSQLTLSNNADNRVITGGSGTNLNGEANLTFDGNDLTVTGTAPAINFIDTDADDYKIHNVQGVLKITDTTASADRFVINDNGTGYFLSNFQIGSTTSSPGATLHINTSYPSLKVDSGGHASDAYVRIISGNAQNSRVDFGDSDDDNVGIIDYDHANNSMSFTTNTTERLRIDAGGLRVNKTTTSDYGRFEVKGPTADDIDTSTDIRTKTVATFSGSTPGTTAAGKGMGIVIKPIADRGSHYFFGAANDSANQESHGRFIIRSGHLASSSTERLRINSSGQVELSQTLLPLVNNTPSIGNGTKNFNSIWASTRFRGNDNVKLVLGNSQDLVIRHDGTDNLIESPQGHNLFIKSGTGDNANLKQIQCNHGGAVVLYYNDAARVTTTSDGISFGGEVNFTSGYNVRTFAGTSYLADGAYVDIVQSTAGYAWSFFEFFCISYHGSIGRAYWKGSMAQYNGDDNYTLSNSMGYCNLERPGANNSANHPIRIQRTGTYGTVQYNYYIRCYAANSTASWEAVTNATKKYDGN